jgi:hypothetical protein
MDWMSSPINYGVANMKSILTLLIIVLGPALSLAAHPGHCHLQLIKEAIQHLENSPSDSPISYQIHRLDKIEILESQNQVHIIGKKMNGDVLKLALNYRPISPPSTGCRKMTFSMSQ